MSLTAYVSLKTVHWTVFRAFDAPYPLRLKMDGKSDIMRCFLVEIGEEPFGRAEMDERERG